MRRDRLAAALHAVPDEVPPGHDRISYLAAGLLLSWCDGTSSAIQVRKHMHNATRDAISHPMVLRFSQIASSDSPQHCNSGLVNLLTKCGLDASISNVACDNGLVSYMIKPSAYIALIHAHYPREFRLHLGADKLKVKEFWTNFLARPAGQDMARGHRFLRNKSPTALQSTIPVVFHEDAGPFSKTASTNCGSFSSLLGVGGEKLTKFLIYSHVTATIIENQKENGFQHLLADFENLAVGIVDGRPVAQDADGTIWCFLFLFSKADEEKRCVGWGLPSYNSINDVCPDCLADRNFRPFTDLQESAKWRPSETLISAMSFRARCREPLHPLIACVFFWRFFTLIDLMHLMDCKGVLALVFGSVLMLLLTEPRLGRTRELRLQAFNKLLEEWYVDHPGVLRMKRILISNITLDGWGNLHGPAIKSANTRGALPAFKSICDRFFDADTEQDSCIRIVFKSLTDFYELLYSCPMFMSDADVARLQQACLDFGRSYQKLREITRRAHLLAWQVTTKVHKMQHVAMLCRVINIRFLQCYADESLVGTTTTVWKKSVSSRWRRCVQRNVLLKRLTGLILRYEGIR